MAGSNNPVARNLRKDQLGGVIFGCTAKTMGECLSKQLFGLPSQHISYVKNIEPGLPLFLFNYSDKKLHGIYEAVSQGKQNIDPYAWTADGSQRTKYSAQVQVIVKMQCQPLPENQFKPIIVDNYFSPNHFLFELDHVQASKLQSKYTSLAIHARPRTVIKNPPMYKVVLKVPLEDKQLDRKFVELTWANDAGSNGKSHDSIGTSGTSDDVYLNGNYNSGESSSGNEVAESDEKDLIYQKLKELALGGETNRTGHVGESAAEDNVNSEQQSEEGSMSTLGKTNSENSLQSSDDIIAKLYGEIEELKAFKQAQTHKVEVLEKKLAEAEREIHRLVRCTTLESLSNTALCADEKSPDELLKESILIVGGHDGSSWSSTTHSFSPSHNKLRALKPMSSARGYAAIAHVNKEIYVFGGGNEEEWYDTVESYNVENNEWTLRQPLKSRTGCLAGAALNGKIYALGGANGSTCFSDVEMLDLNIGYWIPARSMKQKRFGLAAVELNGSIYAVGGYDGDDYLKTAERFDPREHGWTTIGSMDKKKGCHSLVVLNEKIYAIGGYDGTAMVTDVDIYDPRVGTWMAGEPLSHGRGYLCAAVVKDSIYVMGGVTENKDLVEKVEIYKEGQGWQDTYLYSGGKSFASTIVLGDN